MNWWVILQLKSSTWSIRFYTIYSIKASLNLQTNCEQNSNTCILNISSSILFHPTENYLQRWENKHLQLLPTVNLYWVVVLYVLLSNNYHPLSLSFVHRPCTHGCPACWFRACNSLILLLSIDVKNFILNICYLVCVKTVTKLFCIYIWKQINATIYSQLLILQKVSALWFFRIQ